MGPFIFFDTVNAERYLTVLIEEIWPVISTWENIKDLIFMQYGAPPHFAIVIREWLNAHFHGRWMSRDLTPCDLGGGGGLVEGASLLLQTNDYGRT